MTAVKSQRSALIIATDSYTDPSLKRLRVPASDARALAGVLRDPGIGDFEVRTLLNEPAYEVNLAVEEFFADRHADDLLLLHFSCHGVKDEDGELYFAMADTRLQRLGATAVAAEFVNRRMSRSRSRRVVLLLDCCYAGAFEHGMTSRAGEEVGIQTQFGGRGRAVITASSAMEYTFERDQLTDPRALAPSVFTSALVEGLETGDADRDQDGLVTLDELYDYVYDRVRTVTPNQTLGKWTFGVQGELVIARRSRPVTTPAPLPPELQDVIDSPLAPVRAAAVRELAQVLRGTDAGRALAARLALERLTEDDSRATAAAAAEVLGSDKEPQAPRPARTPPEPAPPGRAAPGAPQRTGLSGPSPAPPVTAPEPAPPSAPTTADRGAGPGARRARRRRGRVWAPHGSVPSPLSRPRSTLDHQVADAVRAAVAEGRILFNPPTTMRQGVVERVEVVIARSLDLDDVLHAGLRGRGSPQIETIKTSPFMTVQLTGKAFSITRLTPMAADEQLVYPTARWEFDVRPLHAGERQLILSVALRIPIPGRDYESIAEPVMERKIKVHVDVVYGSWQFIKKNWQWLAGTAVGLGGAITTWIELFHT